MAVDAASVFKVCSSCGVEKPINRFARAKTGRFGVRGDCKECRQAMAFKKDILDGRPDLFCCTSCGDLKPYTLDHFKRKPVGRYGLSTECRACLKKRSALHYKQNKPRYRELAIQWKTANPEKSRHIACAMASRYRARKLSAGGSHTVADVLNILASQKRRCVYCMTVLTKYHVDHIEPISKGGSDDKYNLQILCPRCNRQKSAKPPIQFAQESGLLL
jgi:5-methylcytosine-specific restriction endonuclease McrA